MSTQIAFIDSCAFCAGLHYSDRLASRYAGATRPDRYDGPESTVTTTTGTTTTTVAPCGDRDCHHHHGHHLGFAICHRCAVVVLTFLVCAKITPSNIRNSLARLEGKPWKALLGLLETRALQKDAAVVSDPPFPPPLNSRMVLALRKLLSDILDWAVVHGAVVQVSASSATSTSISNSTLTTDERRTRVWVWAKSLASSKTPSEVSKWVDTNVTGTGQETSERNMPAEIRVPLDNSDVGYDDGILLSIWSRKPKGEEKANPPTSGLTRTRNNNNRTKAPMGQRTDLILGSNNGPAVEMSTVNTAAPLLIRTVSTSSLTGLAFNSSRPAVRCVPSFGGMRIPRPMVATARTTSRTPSPSGTSMGVSMSPWDRGSGRELEMRTRLRRTVSTDSFHPLLPAYPRLHPESPGFSASPSPARNPGRLQLQPLPRRRPRTPSLPASPPQSVSTIPGSEYYRHFTSQAAHGDTVLFPGRPAVPISIPIPDGLDQYREENKKQETSAAGEGDGNENMVIVDPFAATASAVIDIVGPSQEEEGANDDGWTRPIFATAAPTEGGGREHAEYVAKMAEFMLDPRKVDRAKATGELRDIVAKMEAAAARKGAGREN